MSRPAEQDQAVAGTRRAAVAVYEEQLRAAADALAAAIRTGVTDGGETISHLLATAAANLGGMHVLTAARPGSWEADYVDRFLASTVGEDGAYLLQYRTAPIEIVECAETAMGDLDIDWLYDDSFALIDRAEADAIPDGGIWSDEADERLARAEDLIDQLRESDYASYRAAFETQARAAANELRRTRYLPDAVPVRVRWVGRCERDQATSARDTWGTVEFELWETARAQTPPPGFTEPLSDIPGPRTPGEILCATGRMPHQRVPELAHYTDQQPVQPGAAPVEDAGGGEAR